MIAFILGNCEVIAPKGVDVAEALLDMSEVEFKALVAKIAGADNSVPPPSGA
jgi:hypothetical protein